MTEQLQEKRVEKSEKLQNYQTKEPISIWEWKNLSSFRNFRTALQ